MVVVVAVAMAVVGQERPELWLCVDRAGGHCAVDHTSRSLGRPLYCGGLQDGGLIAVLCVCVCFGVWGVGGVGGVVCVGEDLNRMRLLYLSASRL